MEEGLKNEMMIGTGFQSLRSIGLVQHHFPDTFRDGEKCKMGCQEKKCRLKLYYTGVPLRDEKCCIERIIPVN